MFLPLANQEITVEFALLTWSSFFKKAGSEQNHITTPVWQNLARCLPQPPSTRTPHQSRPRTSPLSAPPHRNWTHETYSYGRWWTWCLPDIDSIVGVVHLARDQAALMKGTSHIDVHVAMIFPATDPSCMRSILIQYWCTSPFHWHLLIAERSTKSWKVPEQTSCCGTQ